MAKYVGGKQLSCRDVQFLDKPGKGKMFGQSGVGPQAPGGTGTTRHGPTGSMKRVTGGSTHMFGKQRVKALKPA